MGRVMMMRVVVAVVMAVVPVRARHAHIGEKEYGRCDPENLAHSSN